MGIEDERTPCPTGRRVTAAVDVVTAGHEEPWWAGGLSARDCPDCQDHQSPSRVEFGAGHDITRQLPFLSNQILPEHQAANPTTGRVFQVYGIETHGLIFAIKQASIALHGPHRAFVSDHARVHPSRHLQRLEKGRSSCWSRCCQVSDL